MKKCFYLIITVIMSVFLIAAAPYGSPKLSKQSKLPQTSQTLYLLYKDAPSPKGHGSYGYMDRQGRIVIRPQFRWASQFCEGRACVSRDGLMGGFIDSNGKFIVPDNKYFGCGDFQEGIAVVDLDYPDWDAIVRHILIDKNGTQIGNRVFPEIINDFHEGYAAYGVSPSSPAPPEYIRKIQFSYLNKRGEPATDQGFDKAEDFSDGIAAVALRLNKDLVFEANEDFGTVLWAIIGKDFQLITNYIFSEIGSHHDGLIPVRVGEKWGYIDGKGEVKIDFQYDAVNMRNSERARGDQMSFFNHQTPKKLYDFSEGLAGVCKDGKWGYINTAGATVIPFQYEISAPFSEGLAAVRQNGKWGFIDKSGKMVILPKYTYVLDCQEGLIAVSADSGFFDHYIDKKGRAVRP